MPKPVDLTRVTFIVMREMRRPIMALLIVYSFSILGMTLIPSSINEHGVENEKMSIFHAFYFMTYTATTTGFGEIPHKFSDAQRFWAIICLYTSVVIWVYAIGSIVQLLQNPFLVRALLEWRFSKNVRRIDDDYFILCGFGDTGSVLARNLNEYRFPCVIIDEDEERIKALHLRNYNVLMPGLYADASVPKHLLEAGVTRPNCKAIVAITNNEEVNLKISTTARVLNPKIKIITMSKLEVVEDTLSNLGGEVHVVDPFKTFAHVFSATMKNPGFYALNKWLAHTGKGDINYYVTPPLGKWVICGFGRMGSEVASILNENGIETTIIDPDESKADKHENYIIGRTTSKTLVKAKIEEAVGILASTNDDGQNLGILLNARYFNPNLFTIARQNHHFNEVTFAAAQTDIVMQPTLVTAQKILFLLVAPLLKSFFAYLLENKATRPQEMEMVVENLEVIIGDKTPYLTSLCFSNESSRAVIKCLESGKNVLLGDLLRSPDDRSRAIEVVVFVVKSGNKTKVLPKSNCRIREGDEILFCATKRGERLFHATINNEYKLYYTQKGTFLSRGWVAQGIAKFMKKRGLKKIRLRVPLEGLE